MADATNTPATSRSTAVANPVDGENEKTSPKTMIHTGTTATNPVTLRWQATAAGDGMKHSTLGKAVRVFVAGVIGCVLVYFLPGF
jgi:hypothetical protein